MYKRQDRLLLACTGSFLAAAVGLIGTPTPGVADGPAPTPAGRSPFGRRRVTTHWRYADNLAATHPGLDVDPDPVWLQDGPVWSSGGVTAGIDLALAVVAADLGGAIAQEVARTLVTVSYTHLDVYKRQVGAVFIPRILPQPGPPRPFGAPLSMPWYEEGVG